MKSLLVISATITVLGVVQLINWTKPDEKQALRMVVTRAYQVPGQQAYTTTYNMWSKTADANRLLLTDERGERKAKKLILHHIP